MKILIKADALETTDKYRGVGSYSQNLIDSLKKFDLSNQYFLNAEINNSFLPDLLLIPYFKLFEISLPLFSKTKTIITVHDLIPIKFPDKFPAGLRGNLLWQIQKTLLKKVSGIITDSKVSKEDIVNFGGIDRKKIFVVYPAISQNFHQVKNKSSLLDVLKKYSLPDKFILYVGDCNWNKNIPNLIRAVNKLKLNLVLVGKVFTQTNTNLEHPWNKSIKEVNALSKNCENIYKVGYIPETDLVALYNLAEVYIQPSYYEGFGLPVIESMACGCPVISSTGGSLKEIGVDSVYYFDPGDLETLTKGIIQLKSDNNIREKLIEKGLNRAKLFNQKEFAQGIKNVYAKVF